MGPPAEVFPGAAVGTIPYPVLVAVRTPFESVSTVTDSVARTSATAVEVGCPSESVRTVVCDVRMTAVMDGYAATVAVGIPSGLVSTAVVGVKSNVCTISPSSWPVGFTVMTVVAGPTSPKSPGGRDSATELPP